jgi:hypothetical protein
MLSIYCIPRGNYTFYEGERIPVRGFHYENFGTEQLLGLLDLLKFDVFYSSISMDKLNFDNVSKGEKVRNK